MRIIRSLGIVLIAGCALVEATETRRWVADTAEEFFRGQGDGVAVTEDGTLKPVAGWSTEVTMEEPVVVAGGRLSDGSLIVGTGHPARLYSVKGDTARLVADVPGEQVTAVLVTPSDDVYVASLSPGVLFRLEKGSLTEIARLGDGGVWDLAWFANSVVVAAGSPAAIYRLGKQGMERWVEIPDAHARSLAASGDKLVVGTSGKGLIFGVQPDGQLTLLADSPFTEIPDLVLTPDGSIWAVALVGEPIKPQPSKDKGDESASNGNGAETVTVDLDLPKIDGMTASSELVRLTPEGALLSVHRFAKQVASAVAWDGAGILVGTGYQGEVWRFVDGGGARLTTVDAVQVVAIVGGGEALLTQGPGQIMWRRSMQRESRFRANGQNFPIPVRFGQYSVMPPDDGVRIRFRSGASEKPDESWLPWTDWLPGTGGTVPLPPARSLQWEVEIGDGSAVERVEVALRDINLAPTIEDLTVEEPGVVYLAVPPPTGPVIDRDNPDINGIFTVIDPEAAMGQNSKKGKKYYRNGFRTVSWKTKDLNDDALLFLLEMERDDGFILKIREDLAAEQLGVDTTAVPDGRYRFRLTASDGSTNPGDALTATRDTRWFVVDNTPPEITLAREGDRWTIVVEDGGSAVAKVEWSRDGDRWREIAPTDGILDGLRETFSLEAAEGAHLLVVRAIDLHHNRATAGATEG